MVFKELKSNKGSTLGLVLITLSVLSLLGVTLISVGLASYKIRMTEERIKTSFYMAESGLDQAYGIILEEVSEAVKAANIVVNEKIAIFIENERRLTRESIDTGIEPFYDSPYIHNAIDGTINPEGLVDEAEINAIKNTNWLTDFQYAFVLHINTSGLHSKLVNIDNYVIVDADVSPNKPLVTQIGAHALFGVEYVITLASSFDFEGTTQAVQMEFVISEPTEIIADYFIETHMVEIPKSPIWDNALVADDNIKISGGDVEIRGDVFANASLAGRNSHEWSTSDPRFGGLVVGINSPGEKVNNSSVEITGNVFTNSFVQVRSDDSSIAITGDVFSNSLVLQENTNRSTVTINGNLLTLDDIELNGRVAMIDINGSFSGFSDGSTAVTHDQSSSIVINSPDINDSGGSSINISGTSFLAGTAYVELNNDFLYQTGESLSLGGNFKAYSIPRTRELFWYDPFALIDNSLNVFDKASHFVDVDTYKPNLLNAGYSVNTIDIGTVTQSIGAHINQGAILPTKFSSGLFETTRLASLNAFDTNLDYQYDYSRIFIGNPEIIEHLNTENEIVYITASDVAIIGNDEHGDVGTSIGSTNETIMPAGQTVLTGIVVTNGNVYIRGNITFRGLIAAGGTIYIEDNNPKLFRTDLGFILRKVHENSHIRDVFIPEDPPNPLPFVYLSTAGAADPEALEPYKELVTIRSWEKTN